jgi:hypothetical protein
LYAALNYFALVFAALLLQCCKNINDENAQQMALYIAFRGNIWQMAVQSPFYAGRQKGTQQCL